MSSTACAFPFPTSPGVTILGPTFCFRKAAAGIFQFFLSGTSVPRTRHAPWRRGPPPFTVVPELATAGVANYMESHHLGVGRRCRGPAGHHTLSAASPSLVPSRIPVREDGMSGHACSDPRAEDRALWAADRAQTEQVHPAHDHPLGRHHPRRVGGPEAHPIVWLAGGPGDDAITEIPMALAAS